MSVATEPQQASRHDEDGTIQGLFNLVVAVESRINVKFEHMDARFDGLAPLTSVARDR